MDFKKIINEIKKEKEEKTGINLQIPKENKLKFEALCKSKGTTPTAVLNMFIKKTIEEN